MGVMPRGGQFLLPSKHLPGAFTLEDADEAQRSARDTVSEFVREVIIPQAAKLENHGTNAETSRTLLKKSAELGLLGLEIPEKPYGGAGFDPLTATLMLEMLGIYGSWACTIAAHAGIGTFPLLYYGTDEQKARYLAKLVSGEWPAAYALTEDKAGSNPAQMTTSATPVPGGWILRGGKQYITNAGFTKLITLYAKLPDDGPEQFTAFLVEADWTGVILGAEEKKIGIHGSSTRAVTLENVFVPESNLLGEPHKGKKIALNILNLGRFKLGVICLGAARECLRMATAYSRERTQKGKPIIEFGMVRKRLAEIAMRVTAMEAIVYRTADLLSQALAAVPEDDWAAKAKAVEQFAMECSIVKVFCSEALFWIAKNNVLAHGGNGFTLDYGAARFFLDSIINEIFEGTNDINRQVIFGMFYRLGLVKNIFTPGFWSRYDWLSSHKRSVVLDIAWMLRKYGRDVERHQMLMGAAADNIIDLYVLDSVSASQAKYPTNARMLAFSLLQSELLPAIAVRLRLTPSRERAVDRLIGTFPE